MLTTTLIQYIIVQDLANTIQSLENRVKALEEKGIFYKQESSMIMVSLSPSPSCLRTHTGPPGPPPSPHDLNEEYILRLINNALYNYSADQIARFDFALESAGGSVVDSSSTFDSSRTRPILFGITLPITLSRSTPNAIIQVNSLIN